VKLAFSKPTQSPSEERLILHQFRRIGYDGLQLKGSQYSPFLDSPSQWLAECGEQAGAASALIVGGILDEPGTEYLRRVLRFGEAVGTEMIVFCHGASRENQTAEDLKRYAQQLSDLGREAAHGGLKLSVHNHFNQPLMTPRDLRVFFGAADPETVGLTIDTAHLVKSGIDDVAAAIREFGPFIDNFHLKDIQDGEFRVLGAGRIDFAPVFDAIRFIGYDGWVSADEESGADLETAMTSCLEFMKTGLAL